MTLRSSSFQTVLRRSAITAVLFSCAALAGAQAQVRWVIDPKGSLVWWQIDPNMAHLWGTTCPQEPSWRPGEGRSGGWTTEEAMNAKTLAHGFNTRSDTINVPLYPRRRVRFICAEAVQGQFSLPDTVRWQGAHGQLVVDPKQIVTGEAMRDHYEQNSILGVAVYRDIKYTLDSVVNLVRRGDTLRGTAVGTWELRSVTRPLSVPFRAYPEAGGMRVLAKFGIPVKSLVDDYGVWKRNLGLGVMMGIWKNLFMGVDLLVRPDNRVRLGQ